MRHSRSAAPTIRHLANFTNNHLFTCCWDHQFGHQSDRAPTHQASAPHRRRRHHGPPDPCARAGAGDRRCVVHIPQRRGECFCTVCCLEFARAPRAVATAPPSRRRPGRWCGVWRLHAGVQVWRLWVVRARQEGALQALPPCTNWTALIDLCLNGAPCDGATPFSVGESMPGA